METYWQIDGSQGKVMEQITRRQKCYKTQINITKRERGKGTVNEAKPN